MQISAFCEYGTMGYDAVRNIGASLEQTNQRHVPLLDLLQHARARARRGGRTTAPTTSESTKRPSPAVLNHSGPHERAKTQSARANEAPGGRIGASSRGNKVRTTFEDSTD